MKYIILIKFTSLFTSRSTADSGGHKMTPWGKVGCYLHTSTTHDN